MTKFSGTLRSVSQNFSLAAIYDVEIANNSANLQKIPMFDLNTFEELTSKSISAQESWSCMLHNFSSL